MKGLTYLAAAYTAVWVGLFGYLVSMGRRASRLEKELAQFRRDDRSGKSG